MNALSRDYATALAKHLEGGGKSSLNQASLLGRRAVSLGLETLDLARIHEQALALAGKPVHSRNTLNKGAQRFFIEANLQIERTHDTAGKANRQWNRMSATLKTRTNELAVSIREVKKKIGQRKVAEETLKTRNAHYEKLLKESKAMQANLRTLAHRVLWAQENERGQISRELHDEIAQVLLGIHVRLITLERRGSRDARKLLKDIASAERLVENCVLTMRRAARKFETGYGK